MHHNIVIRLLLFISICFRPSLSDGKSIEWPIEVRLIPGDTPSALEPWRFQIAIKNNSTKPISLLPLNQHNNVQLLYGSMSLEIKSVGDTAWVQSAYPQTMHLEMQSTPDLVTLLPGTEILSDTFVIPSPFVKGDGRQYDVRIIYYLDDQAHSYSITSNVSVVKIIPYDDNDTPAYMYLMKQPDAMLLYRPIFPTIYGSEYHDFATQATYIDNNFPHSRFASWAKLYLSFYYYERAFKSKDLDIGEQVESLRNAKNFIIQAANSNISDVQFIAKSRIKMGYFYIALSTIYKGKEIPEALFNEFTFKK